MYNEANRRQGGICHMKTMSVKEASQKWGITERRVSTLCNKGRIPGTVKSGKIWRIPCDAEKPADLRVKNGTYQKGKKMKNLPMPVGISDYRLASTQYYYAVSYTHLPV